MNLFDARRPDLTFEQFSKYWQNKHRRIVQTVPKVKSTRSAMCGSIISTVYPST